jgi:hypothetical protein
MGSWSRFDKHSNSFSSIQPADRQRDLGAHTCQCMSCFDADTRRAASDDSALPGEIDTLENLVNRGAEAERGFDTFHYVHRDRASNMK